MAPARSPKKVCTVIGFALFAMMLVWLGGVTLAQHLVGRFAPRLAGNGWVVWLTNDIPLYLLAAPVYLGILALVPNGPQVQRPRHRVGPARYIALLAFCFGATYALNLTAVTVLMILQSLFGGFSTDGLSQAVTAMGTLPNLVFGVAVPALGEEFLFRYTLRRKLRGCADSTYILMSGLVFHFSTPISSRCCTPLPLGCCWPGSIWSPATSGCRFRCTPPSTWWASSLCRGWCWGPTPRASSCWACW